MRADMKQVLIERPRRGWRSKHQRTNKPRVSDWDGEDMRVERVAPRPPRTKYFDDLLGPLRKYLRAQIGRPWDKVFSEICASIDSRTVTGRHLLHHFLQEIEVDCQLDTAGNPGYAIHNRHRPWAFSGLYVHPHTGLVCYAPKATNRQRWIQRQAEQSSALAAYRKLSDDTFLLNRQGSWHWVKIGPVFGRRDDRLKHVVLSMGLKMPDGCLPFILESRQLSRKELRQQGLQNGSNANAT